LAKPHAALRAFGLQLRQVREDAGISGRAMAELLGWPPSKISKLEHGQQTATAADVVAWVGAAGAAAGVLERLVAGLERARLEYAAWRQQLADGTRARQQSRLRAEAEVSSIRAFEPAVVPGLLQTPDYARHVLAGIVEMYGVVDDVEEGVRVRLRRQELLYNSEKRFRFLMAEPALYCQMAPREVMIAQIDRLLVAAGMETVELSIVPFSARWPVGPLNGYWIFDDQYVLIETLSAELTVTEPADVDLYARIFDTMWARAVSGDGARAVLLRASQAYREPGDPIRR